MNRSILIIVGVVLLVGGWFLVSPLFIDRSVDEDFSFVADNGQIDMQAIMAMPEEKRLTMKSEIMDAAAGAPDRAAVETMPTAAPVAIAHGSFVDADAIHKGSGRATIYALANAQHILRFEGFRTTNGPDLVVYLAKHASPTNADHVTEGGYLKLGKLKGNVGNQNYPIPEGTNVAEYNSVVIWCELFGVLFSPAALSRG